MSSAAKTVVEEASGLAQLLRQRGFVDLVSSTVRGEEYWLANYGPLGTLLRRNILKQWWSLMVSTQTNVFAIESPPTHNLDLDPAKTFSRMRHSLQQDCAAKYPQVLKLTNGKLPISIASVGTCFVPDHRCRSTEVPEKTLLLGSCLETKLNLQNYVSPSNVNAIHDFWLQARLSWWKKYARSPEHFTVASSGVAGGGGDVNDPQPDQRTEPLSETSVNIVYEFPWGCEVLESVTNLADSLHRRVSQTERETYMVKSAGKKAFLPSCIECSTSVEAVLAAWLVDAYSERSPSRSGRKQGRHSKVHQVLQLHHHVTPYQVAIAVGSPALSSSSNSSSLGNELRYISEHLEKDLKKSGISVFNASHHGGSVDAHCKRNDQLGVVYTVILDESTVSEGLVSTRSRDTQVKVISHISSLVKELQRNLNAQLD